MADQLSVTIERTQAHPGMKVWRGQFTTPRNPPEPFRAGEHYQLELDDGSELTIVMGSVTGGSPYYPFQSANRASSKVGHRLATIE